MTDKSGAQYDGLSWPEKKLIAKMHVNTLAEYVEGCRYIDLNSHELEKLNEILSSMARHTS